MSKQSDNKRAMRYVPKFEDTCCNCLHFRSEITIYAGGWEKERERRCHLGRFAVKRMGTCSMWSKFNPNIPRTDYVMAQ